MPSSAQKKRIRKSPEARRAEIVHAGSVVALSEGLECVTLRRIAEQLDVRPGLIGHYFPSVEDLVAEAFGAAASGELDMLIPADHEGRSPAYDLARFFALSMGGLYDDVSRLWINARHLSRYRTALRDRVARQEAAWRERLEGLIRAGAAEDVFRTDDPHVAAVRILVVIDGLGSHANTDDSARPESVRRMAVTLAEHDLGLAPGTLLDHPGAREVHGTDHPDDGGRPDNGGRRYESGHADDTGRPEEPDCAGEPDRADHSDRTGDPDSADDPGRG